MGDELDPHVQLRGLELRDHSPTLLVPGSQHMPMVIVTGFSALAALYGAIGRGL